MSSADLVPGSSGSPVVNRKGEVVGVADRVPNMINQLAFVDGESGSGAVAARGILEVLDKVYHADELVAELSGDNGSAKGSAEQQEEPRFPNAPIAPSILPLPKSLPPLNPPLISPPTFPVDKASPLGQRNKELVPALIKALQDTDQEVAHDAATVLGILGSDAVPALIEALQAKDKTLRGRAAMALGKLRSADESAVNALLKAMEDEEVEVRRQAARALAAIARDRSPTPETPRRP